MSETLLQSRIDTFDSEGIEALNAEFAQLAPRERIRRAYELLDGEVVLATTFGPTAPLLLQAAHEATPDIPVVSIRHGHETEETLTHAEFYTHRFNLSLHIYEPLSDVSPRSQKQGVTDFQWQAKIEPFQRALTEQAARGYISGAISWQTDERKDWSFVEKRGDMIAIFPLLDVTRQEVEAFFEETGLPRNEDYYDPTKGPDQKTECRLNTVEYIGSVATARALTS